MAKRINLRNPKSGLVSVTPSDAKQILSEMTFSRQRKRRDLTIEKFSRLMAEGGWVSGQTIEFAIEGRDYVLVNGQHRLQAQINQNFTAVYNLLVSDLLASELYPLLDTVPRLRTQSEILAAMGSDRLANYDDVGITLSARIGRACVAIGKRAEGLSSVLPGDSERIWNKYITSILLISKIFDQSSLIHEDYQRLQSANILGLIIYSLSQGEKYHDFWCQILSNQGDWNSLTTFLVNRGNSTSRLSSAAILALQSFDENKPRRSYNSLRTGQELEWRGWNERVSYVSKR